MLWLYILAAIVLLIALLLYAPIRINLKYHDELFVTISYFFIHYKFFPRNKKQKENVVKKTKKSGKKVIKKEKRTFISLVKTHGLPTAVSEITDTIKTTVTQFSKLFRHVNVRNFSLTLGVVGEDAAKAAINYGLVCAAVYPMLGFLSTAMIFSKPKINIYCDYDSKSPIIEGKAILSVKVLFLLKAAVSVLIILIKEKLASQKAATKRKATANRTKNIKGGTSK